MFGHAASDVRMSEFWQCAFARRMRKVVLTFAGFCGLLLRSSSQPPECNGAVRPQVAQCELECTASCYGSWKEAKSLLQILAF